MIKGGKGQYRTLQSLRSGRVSQILLKASGNIQGEGQKNLSKKKASEGPTCADRTGTQKGEIRGGNLIAVLR